MFDLRGDVVDYRPARDGCCEAPRPAKPAAVWLLVALIGLVLGGAAVLGSLSTDTRDYAAKHQSVLKARVI